MIYEIKLGKNGGSEIDILSVTTKIEQPLMNGNLLMKCE